MGGLPSALSVLEPESVWVAWDDVGGRKVPKSPFGGNARSNDPATWGTYAEAVAAAERNGYSGVGIMLSDGLVGIDLDHVVGEGGQVEAWAQEVIDSIASYTELSPSGTGVHVLAYADPESVGAIGRADHRSGIEVYNHGRYFTVTGRQVGTSGIKDRTGEVSRLVAERFGASSAESRLRDAIRATSSDQVRRLANETMRKNASRDGLRYARVPGSGETCGFCIMLASRGFVYWSAETAGEGNHYHRNCRCKVVPGFDGMEVEGYDPDALYGLYSEARSRSGSQPSADEVSRQIEKILSERSESQLGSVAGRTSGLPATKVLDGVRYDASDPAQVADFIETYAAVSRDAEEEHSFILQRDGTVREGVGDGWHVSLEGAEMDGAVVLHNHLASVEEASFSQMDFDVYCEYPEIAEMVLAHGEHIYSMVRKGTIEKGVWDDAFADVDIDDLTSENMQDVILAAIAERGLIDYGTR